MKINFQNIYNNKNISPKNPNITQGKILDCTPLKDCVLFRSKTTNQDENLKIAQEFSDELDELAKSRKLNPKEIQKIGSKYIPNLEVKQFKGFFKKRNNGYFAAAQSEYNDDFSLKKISIFIPKVNYKSDKRVMAGTQAAIVHEFTHALQYEKDDSIKKLKPHFQTYKEAKKVLKTFIEPIFGATENNLHFILVEGLSRQCIHKSQRKMLYLLPADDTSPEKLIQTMGFKSRQEFEEQMKKRFEENFNYVLSHLKENDKKEMPYINEPEKLQKIAKESFMQRCQAEREAYTADSETLKKTAGVSGNANSDFLPVLYYLMQCL